MKDCKQTMDDTPCEDFKSFKKLVLAVMGLQTTMVIVTLTITLNIMASQSANAEKLIEFSTKQRNIEKKADEAFKQASTAFAMSSKAESNIAWIREGLTELKLAVRESKYKPRTNP